MSDAAGKLIALHPSARAVHDDAPVLIGGRGVRKTYRTREGDVETLKPQ